MFPFYAPSLKTLENLWFLVFSGGIKWEHWAEIQAHFLIIEKPVI